MNAPANSPRRQLFDPETIPLDPTFSGPDTRGTAVAPERLRPTALRQRFSAPLTWQPELRADPRLWLPDLEARPAAVLVPLIARSHGVQVLLTQRTAHLSDHAGQISFPGGRVEENDADARATALREAQEEVGLAAERVEVIGQLPQYTTATGYDVTPVVGLVEGEFDLVLDAFEVSEVFEVPLAFLMNPAHHERRIVQLGELSRTFYAMPYEAERRYFIWGATAAMLRNLYQFLRA
jgi:8-oxo-dGTP pyrophosphatase MutT (NUDIX family)